MRINVRSKGQTGEREFCKLLTVQLELKKPLERNVDQVRDGGADIITLRPFAIEVKRQQTLEIKKWLRQAVDQVTKKNPIPILAYRQNSKPWQVMVPFVAVSEKRFRKGVHKHHFITMDVSLFIIVAKSLISLHKKR